MRHQGSRDPGDIKDGIRYPFLVGLKAACSFCAGNTKYIISALHLAYIVVDATEVKEACLPKALRFLQPRILLPRFGLIGISYCAESGLIPLSAFTSEFWMVSSLAALSLFGHSLWIGRNFAELK
mmetsp:Transcript_2476/g.6491  ORF Transcript_2476/g.6491 Transcript_2476/m.6491 type:complete len:125 (-) Transcript_2476:1665-2039(-)